MKAKTMPLTKENYKDIKLAIQEVIILNVEDKKQKIEVVIQNVKTCAEKRRIIQNNLWYHWIGEYKNFKFWTEKHARGYLKYEYALPILRRNPAYNIWVKMFDSIADNVGSNKDLHIALKVPMTSLLTIDEMTELLEETQRQVSLEDGFYLTDKHDMEQEALGRGKRA